MARPNPERQIHRACGDVRAALLEALELLSESTVPDAGCDDMFRAFSDLGSVQRRVAVALWSYYRSRIGKKPLFVLNSADGDHGFARRASAS